MTRWQRYWFADGGRVALAIVRVAVAIAVMLTLSRLRGTWPANAPGAPGVHDAFRPVGVWMVLGGAAPSDAVIDALWVLAWLGAIAMLVGAVTRAAIAVTFAAGCALAAASYGGFAQWSHQYNVVWIAVLALLGARAGDALSIDRLVRTKLRGLPPRDVPRGYQWSLRLVQLAVAVMFFSGMFHKALHGGLALRWAFSDNLRVHLLERFDLHGIARPAIVDWMIDDAWKYETAALLNLVTQALPLAAIFLVRRPVLRAACGAFFAIETLALGVVMQLWNLHWLPLVAVFVDWEALLAWLTRRPIARAEPAAGWRAPRAASAFIIAFVAYDAITALAPSWDQRLNTYPFSSFPMFANIRARKPYGEHRAYAFASGYLELVADRPMTDADYHDFDYTYRTIVETKRPAELRAKLAAVLGDAQRRCPDCRIHAVRAWRAIYEAPAYPAPARLDRRPVAIVGEARDDGTYHTLVGDIARAPRTLDWQLPFVDGDPLYLIERVDGAPWLVASLPRARVD